MIKVELINHGAINDAKLISFSAKGCYQPEKPIMGETMDIVGKLFKTGHHTTFQHGYFTFWIEDIAISDVTFGLHLVNPFYNTSQRSGRFCGKMFQNPDYEEISSYIKTYWPELDEEQLTLAIHFVRDGIVIYQKNLSKAVDFAKELIREERPFASEKYIDQNAPKFAQEQLRVFIPTIFPTALTYTANLSAIIAMHCSSWSPALIDISRKMMDAVISLYPETLELKKILEIVNEVKHSSKNLKWLPAEDIFHLTSAIRYNPSAILSPKDKDYSSKFRDAIIPPPEFMHPIDLLHFHPAFMENSVSRLESVVNISVATMGQDQRHRMISRGKPRFTGEFYLPPIPRMCGLTGEAIALITAWKCLFKQLPKSLALALVPYGAMVSYKKSGSLNAVAHELNKRLCWTAQEEIYHSALNLRKEISEKCGADSPLLAIFPPSCVRTGKCGEGDRYCGRDMKKDCFIERKI
ncbi:MAG: FAD-dependent thymidylate synthase [Patescibacteria group bacterium]